MRSGIGTAVVVNGGIFLSRFCLREWFGEREREPTKELIVLSRL